MGENDTKRTSRIPGFYKQSIDERLARVQDFAGLTDRDVEVLRGYDPVKLRLADQLIENVAGLFEFPVGIAANFRVDGTDVLLPMVIEESSVVAAASNAGKLLREGQGILTRASEPWMIGQIQLLDLPDPAQVKSTLEAAASELLRQANASQPRLVRRGGGAREMEVRLFESTPLGPMIVLHLMVDVCDAMGANLVNSMVETLAPRCEELTGARAGLRILSNLADRRLVHAEGRVPLRLLARPDLHLEGLEVAKRIEEASIFAEIDPYRAATHNKGMMNGVDAFLIATGQDWRAVEAGVHAYAAREGRYQALACWRVEDEHLVGRVTLPMQVGVVGGVTKVHPVVQVLLRVAGAQSASHMGRLTAALGLAQNLAAILALATEGIQRGHMSLHARNIALSAGVSDRNLDHLVREMIRRNTINLGAAQSILQESLSAEGAPSLDFKILREENWPLIEASLESHIPRDGPEGSLNRLMWYPLDTGGKRVRAVIPLAIAHALGRDSQVVVPLSAAMEILHNATLVHSDAQARDRLRRGQPALWVRYGLDQAINCGDALLCVATQVLDDLPAAPHVIQRLKSLQSGYLLEIIRAQVDEHLGEDASPDRWLELAGHRVGGLFKLAVRGAALLCEVDSAHDKTLDDIGAHFGVIFMVQDELMDLLGATKGAFRGQSIRAGRVNGLLSHFFHSADSDVRNRAWELFSLPSHLTTDLHVSEVLGAMEKVGSFRYAVDLIRDQQRQVLAKCVTLDPALRSALHAIAQGFLDPLLQRLDA